MSVVEVTEPTDLLSLVKDVALNLHLAHHAQLAEVAKQVRARNVGLEGDGVLRQFVVAWLSLSGGGYTSCTTASVAAAKEKTPLRTRLLMELSIISTAL